MQKKEQYHYALRLPMPSAKKLIREAKRRNESLNTYLTHLVETHQDRKP